MINNPLKGFIDNKFNNIFACGNISWYIWSKTNLLALHQWGAIIGVVVVLFGRTLSLYIFFFINILLPWLLFFFDRL